MANIQTDSLTVTVSRLIKRNTIMEAGPFIPGELIQEIDKLLTALMQEHDPTLVIEVDRIKSAS